MKDKSIILIVDDQSQNIELLEAYLVQQDYVVIKASSGTEALEKVFSNQIDLILLDIMMPKMSGIEVLEKLRADEKTQLIPVVMVTALRETGDKIKAFQAGCDDFISKPFDKVELLARVKAILKMSYYRRALDEKEKFTAAIGGMKDGVVVCAKDWSIKSINLSALKYLNLSEADGVNLAEVIFSKFSVLIPKDNFLNINFFSSKFDIFREETEKNNSFYLSVNKDVLKNPDGVITSIVLTLRDVSDERREDYLKQDFLGLISHKLRTPLTVINGNISLLQEGLYDPLTSKQVLSINTVAKESLLLTRLVERLLGYIMINNRKFCHPQEVLEIKRYLSVITDPVIKQAEHKKIKLVIDCNDELKLKINKTCFNQIIENLIENAIKFGDKEIVNISIVVKKIDKEMEIAIEDNGPGIPNEEFDRIFDKFYQGGKDFTGQVEGIGLGLAIVKKLIEGQGGKIKVRSDLEQGSTFILTLPIDL